MSKRSTFRRRKGGMDYIPRQPRLDLEPKLDVPAIFDPEAFLKEQEAKREARSLIQKTDPVKCRELGISFTGTMPDKGLKDGSCNRSACQMPLKGRIQYSMDSYGSTADGKFYYCADCEKQFTHWDKIDRPGQPLRCTLVKG